MSQQVLEPTRGKDILDLNNKRRVDKESTS